jgi:NitT/TauT family transport system substrate-binding protein
MFRRALYAFVLAVVVSTAGCGPSDPDVKGRPPIRLGSYEWPGSYWIDVAWDKGWFAAAGLNVERIDTNLKYFESLDGVAAGTLDGMGFSQFDLVRHVAAGHDLVGVAALDYSEGAEALIAAPGIHRMQDLRGKRIGLERGTYLEYLLDVAAERSNIDLHDIELVDTKWAVTAEDLKSHRVDAVFSWGPGLDELQEAVGGQRVFSTAEFPGLTYNVLAFRREFVQSRPQDVMKLLGVWRRTVEFIREHPDEACAIVARLVGDPAPSVRKLMFEDRILDLADNTRAFSYAAGSESLHGSWRRMNDFMLERGLVKQRVDSPVHLDARFVNALD